jgi:hypothetical protein
MSDRSDSGMAVGLIYFAAVMMIMIGIFHAMNGFMAIVHKLFFHTPPNYVFAFNVSTWGWVHLIVGIAIMLAGFGVLSGSVVARTIGVILALISAIAGFAFIPYYPVMAIVFIAVDILVIWALTLHGRAVGVD